MLPLTVLLDAALLISVRVFLKLDFCSVLLPSVMQKLT